MVKLLFLPSLAWVDAADMPLWNKRCGKDAVEQSARLWLSTEAAFVLAGRARRRRRRQAVLDVLHEARFVDLAPAEVYATLLDEGRYLCSIRTTYRLLAFATLSFIV